MNEMAKKKSKAIQRFFCLLICSIVMCLFFSCDSEKTDIERGNRYVDRKDYDRAIQNYSFAIETNPANPNTYYCRGVAKMLNRELDAAINDFSMAIKFNPGYFDALINRGAILKEKGKLDEALIDYNKAVQLKPDEFQVLLPRADIWFIKQSFDKAIFDYDIYIKNNPKSSVAYRGRGDSHYYRGNYQEAINDYLKVIEFNSKDSFAYNNLAWILSTCVDENFRDGEKALQYSQIAVNLDPSPYNLSTLAAAYAENNKFEDAAKILKKLINNRKNNNELYEKLNSYLIIIQKHQPLREKADFL